MYLLSKQSNEFEQAPKACSCCKKRAVVGEKDDPTGVFVEPLTTVSGCYLLQKC